jgi:autotransporter-associated beta strand protein
MQHISAKKQIMRSGSVLLAFSLLTACHDGGSSISVPDAPAAQGYTETVALPDVATPFVDAYKTNITANTTTDSNAALNLLSGFNELWTAGSSWNNGSVLNATTLQANQAYVVSLTSNRTADEATNAYLYDRQSQNYSIIGGLGPLADIYKTGAGATTTVTDVASDAATVKYTDTGTGAGDASSSLGKVVDLVSALRGNYASTTPAKTYFSYPRPWRLTDDIRVENTGATDSLGFPVYTSNDVVVPALLPTRSLTPASDGGFPSGHTNASYLAGLALAYAIPERFTELVTRASEVGNSRILAGMHSPLDVMGGRTLATALAAATLNDSDNATLKLQAYTQAHTYLESATSTTANTLYSYAHSATTSDDAYADDATNQSNFLTRMTNTFAQIDDSTAVATVPKGAEVLLETRFPYLTAAQRRVVLKTTEISSGYPVISDTEGWGRLNLAAAGDGYGSFTGDVTVTMNASDLGFNAVDRWKNDISGTGQLIKSGTGELILTGDNSFSGGTHITAGTVTAGSATAMGTGNVYISNGTFKTSTADTVTVSGDYTQSAGSTQLQVSSTSVPALVVNGELTVGSGALVLTFADGFAPTLGSSIQVITAGGRSGGFDSVSASGYNVSLNYSKSGVRVTFNSKSVT